LNGWEDRSPESKAKKQKMEKLKVKVNKERGISLLSSLIKYIKTEIQ
jgi:hypothetical protein